MSWGIISREFSFPIIENPDRGSNGNRDGERSDEGEGEADNSDEPDESSSKNKLFVLANQPEILKKVIQESKGVRNDSKKNKSIVKEEKKLRKKVTNRVQ